MSKHQFTIDVEVDQAALVEHNAQVEEGTASFGFPEDPDDWSLADLVLAYDEEIATGEVVAA